MTVFGAGRADVLMFDMQGTPQPPGERPAVPDLLHDYSGSAPKEFATS